MIAETSNRTVTRIESSLWVERSSFYLRRNNLRLKQLACWPPLYSDAFENIDEPRTPYSVMIAETISSACFVLLVVVFCCMIKIYTMVKNIRPSRNERVRVVCARDNERALPVEREPTVYFSRAERSAGQHGTCNNTTYSGSQARRRQPQTKNVRGFQYNSKFFFVLTTCNHSSCILSFVVFLDLMWYCVHHFHGSFRLEFITGNWRVLDQKRIPESSSEVEVASGEHLPSREAAL